MSQGTTTPSLLLGDVLFGQVVALVERKAIISSRLILDHRWYKTVSQCIVLQSFLALHLTTDVLDSYLLNKAPGPIPCLRLFSRELSQDTKLGQKIISLVLVY